MYIVNKKQIKHLLEKNVYKTIWEEVAIGLRNKILTGQIKQGERIKEAELAEQFGVSRGPVREAMRQLEQEGLLEYSSRKGCAVKAVSATESAESYLLRANLENLAVRMCRGKFSTETIHRMRQVAHAMDQCVTADQLPDIVKLDQQFHELLVTECGIDKLLEMWHTLDHINVSIFYALYHTRFAPNDHLGSNHMMVVDALEKGDAEEICKAIQEHYMIVSYNLFRTEQNAEQTDAFFMDGIRI